MPSQLVRLSTFLSLVLRHQPDRIGLPVDQGGWAEVDELIRRAQAARVPLTRQNLEQVVAQNDKRRFAFSPDGRRIRANQGHSIPVDLGLDRVQPPAQLYHGTAARFVPAIRREGLVPGRRHQVHLSADEGTARQVGARHGRPVVLVVEAAQMAVARYAFYRSDNGVWLTDAVPPGYLTIPPY